MSERHCPRCSSGALYRYGFSPSGKQRYRCQACLHQFVDGPSKKKEPVRPFCPLCGAMMHVHHRRGERIAYRCSSYPECRGYLSVEERL